MLHVLLTLSLRLLTSILVLHLPARVSSALVLLFILLTRNRSSEYRRPSSIVFLRLRSAFGNLALPLLFFWSPLALGRGAFSVLCLNSLAAHRDLSHLSRTSPLASGAVLQRHFVVVFDSVVRFWPPPTPLLSIAPLRDCWFAVGALAPQESSLQQRGLLSVRIGFSFARYFSLTVLKKHLKYLIVR